MLHSKQEPFLFPKPCQAADLTSTAQCSRQDSSGDGNQSISPGLDKLRAGGRSSQGGWRGHRVSFPTGRVLPGGGGSLPALAVHGVEEGGVPETEVVPAGREGMLGMANWD